MTAGIALAPAISQPGTAVLKGADNSGTSHSVGSFVRTGAPCTTSGWWKCLDSEAVDRTRWFAQGDLLPAATFHVAQKKLLFAAQGVTVFQRRSTWQLVRPASEQDEQSA